MISRLYNYLVDFLVHLKWAFDSMKIYMVYFLVFFYQTKLEKGILQTCEFFYTLGLLLLHLRLYKRRGNVRSWVFYAFFLLYFAALSCTFVYQYLSLFLRYFE